ncbi:MAG TPA: hypothetical protein PKH10_00210 [bacterium]|nr:hypothetical protein [bacterium]
MGKRLVQSDHDLMVAAYAKDLMKLGYEVAVDLPGLITPAQIGEHIPDITAKDPGTGKFHVFEVETSDSINDEHTASQWLTFAVAAAIGNSQFHVIVPKAAYLSACLRVKALTLNNVDVIGF